MSLPVVGSWKRFVLFVFAGAFFWSLPVIRAQQTSTGELKTEPFQETVERAKKSGRPLAVFGMSDTCSRCQAVKQALAERPELKLLMTQYEFSQIPFGGQEFGAVFQELVRRDPNIPASIGAPSVFILTARGETVYAGPNRESGISPDDELKQLLIAGIEKNGGQAAKLSQTRIEQLETNPGKASRTWKSANGKFSVTASLVTFDGKTVSLKTTDEKTINVPVQSLSAEDQAYLAKLKPPSAAGR